MDLLRNKGKKYSLSLSCDKCNWSPVDRWQILKKLNPFAPADFAEKRVLKLVEWFSGRCRAIKS